MMNGVPQEHPDVSVSYLDYTTTESICHKNPGSCYVQSATIHPSGTGISLNGEGSECGCGGVMHIRPLELYTVGLYRVSGSLMNHTEGNRSRICR